MSSFLKRTITAIALCLSFIFVYLFTSSTILAIGILALALYVLCIEWNQFNNWLLTPLYPLAPFLALAFIAYYDKKWLLLLCLVICAHDTGAYITGILWGKTKLAPKISPGKTYEGLVGGFIVSLVVGFIFLYYDRQQFTFQPVGMFILIISLNVAAVCGDLFESYLKRKAHIKDSGNLLPGHGGVLDRCDSILFGALILIIILLIQSY